MAKLNGGYVRASLTGLSSANLALLRETSPRSARKFAIQNDGGTGAIAIKFDSD